MLCDALLKIYRYVDRAHGRPVEAVGAGSKRRKCSAEPRLGRWRIVLITVTAGMAPRVYRKAGSSDGAE